MRTNVAILGFLVATMGTPVFACNAHPGMTHEEWSSKVESQKTKNGAEKTLDDAVFSDVGKDQKKMKGENGGDWKGPRRINNTYQGN